MYDVLLLWKTTSHEGQIEVYYWVDRLLSWLYCLWDVVFHENTCYTLCCMTFLQTMVKDRGLISYLIVTILIKDDNGIFYREDLRKSFGRSNTISSVSADNETVTTSVAGEEKEGVQVENKPIKFTNILYWMKKNGYEEIEREN